LDEEPWSEVLVTEVKLAPLAGQSDRTQPFGSCEDCNVKDMAFCANLEQPLQACLRDSAVRVNLAKGEFLATEGRPGDGLCVVIEGAIVLCKTLPGERRQIMGFRFPGDILTLGRKHDLSPVTIRALTRSQVCHVRDQTLQEIAAKHASLALALLDAAREEIAEYQEHLLTIGRKRTDEKVASFLLAMGRYGDDSGDTGEEIRLSMHRPEIADFLGLETETVSRVLSKWRREEILDLPHPSHVVVRDWQVLEDLAAGRRTSRRA
jgi:CRP/FNR family transcriptional regulator